MPGAKGSGGKKKVPAKLKFDGRTKIFERHPKESGPAWEAFKLYRDGGDTRTLAKVAETLGKSSTLIEGWSRDNDWRNRVVAWDNEKDRRKRNVELKQIEAMRKRQLQLAASLQGYGGLELEKLINTARQNPNATVTADQVLRLISEGIKLERLNMGEPESITETRAGERSEGLENLSDEELLLLRNLKVKMDGG